MPTWLAIAISLVGLTSTCLGMVMVIRNIKNTSPMTAFKTAFEIYKKECDQKLDNDNRRLTHLERSFERMEELDRLLLRSVKGILGHLSEGNHTDTMRKLISQIDDHLIGNR